VRRSQAYAEVENFKNKKAVEVIQDVGMDLAKARVLYSRYPYFDSKYQVLFESDFIEGQKTGLFLDQSYNIGVGAQWATHLFHGRQTKVKILDLCCYRGAWSAHISQHLKMSGISCEVHLLDQSSRALDQASRNVSPFADSIQTHEGDVMTLLDNISESDFHILISDPPAFAKSKKALGSAIEGYYQLNRKALRRTAKESLYVACSCSSVVSSLDFQKVIERALLTQSHRQIQYLNSGGHALDHTLNPFFPEGEYLKMRGYWLS
jgi:23S rRNA (cytosine1962-C5)-methyltransferase